MTSESPAEILIPDSVIPAGTLPPLRQRQMPEPVSLRQMIGPSIILAGLALGSGEFILWPYITFRSGFVFFWACILAVVMQYFLNMEIMRWTLATGESAVAGFVRLSRSWAWIFLLLNVLPWMIPAWSKGAAQIIGWLIFGPTFDENGGLSSSPYDTYIAIATMFLCGIILTAGPVVYETVEKVQLVLVLMIMVIVVGIAVWLTVLRPDGIVTQITSMITFGYPQFRPPMDESLTPMALLGALAFAGAGGTMNLSQSNYIKDKGYGMGNHLGRITSPLTGNEEAISETGYHFPHDEANLARWKKWWRAAGLEHFVSFFLTCIVCLMLLTLISYILFYDASGKLTVDPAKYKEGLGFVWAETEGLVRLIGTPAKYLFLIMGVAILFTTEFGVLDAASRISTDLIKLTWLRDDHRWSEGRLYYWLLWGEICLGSSILVAEKLGYGIDNKTLFVWTAALNGAVMFLYSGILLYRNRVALPECIRIPLWRSAILVFTFLFFGFFTAWAGREICGRVYRYIRVAPPASSNARIDDGQPGDPLEMPLIEDGERMAVFDRCGGDDQVVVSDDGAG